MLAESTFPLGLESAALARHFVEQTLDGWHGEDLIDTAGLLTSELVSNSSRHAHTPCSVRLTLLGDELVVEVGDDDPTLPMPQEARFEVMGGRGLMIVAALAQDWGARRRAGGKTVWFRLARRR